MNLTVGTNSWVSEADAGLYFEERYPSSAWDGAESLDRKKALASAFRQISNLDGYDLPSTSQDLKDAQCEQAYFLLAWGDDMERRDAMRAGGVRQVGVGGSGGFQEVYEGQGVSISPRVLDLLEGYSDSDDSPLTMGEITRDDTIL